MKIMSKVPQSEGSLESGGVLHPHPAPIVMSVGRMGSNFSCVLSNHPEKVGGKKFFPKTQQDFLPPLFSR